MTVTKQAWASSLGVADRKVRGKRDPQPERFRHDYPVAIAAISGAGAPVAFETVIGDHVFTYRAIGDQLYRPLIAPDGSPMTGGVEVFAERLTAMTAERAPGVRLLVWSDNPFGRVIQKRAGAALYDVDHSTTLDALPGAPVADNQFEVEAMGARIAREELLEIDGMMYRTAPEPIWIAVDRPPYDGVVEIKLILPDFEQVTGYSHDYVAASFRYDQKDVALAYAAKIDVIAETCRTDRGFPPGGRIVARVADSFVRDVGGFRSAQEDVERLTVKAMSELITYATCARSLEHVSLDYIKGHVAIRALGEKAKRGAVDPGEALEAFATCRAAIGPEDRNIPRVDTGYHQCLVYEAWREAMREMRPEMAEDLDVAALSAGFR